MDETTARSELLGRMPELHRILRERINEIDCEICWSLKVDFLVLAIGMFGDRELLDDYFNKFKRSSFHIGEEEEEQYDDVWSIEDLCIAICSVEEDTWLECLDSVTDHLAQRLPDELFGLSFKLFIRCERTMQLANVVLDRIKGITGLIVSVEGFDPSPASTGTFIQALKGLTALGHLRLEGITVRRVFWSTVLKYAFHKPPKSLVFAKARGSHLVASLAKMRHTTTLVPFVRVCDCIIDDKLLSLLLTMPISSLSLDESSRIRGHFSTVANALASNTTLQELDVECDDVCSSFTKALLNAIANNVTLEVLKISSLAVEPFSSLCRAVGRHCSIRDAVLRVSTPMDNACMYELAQSPRLEELTLWVEDNRRSFSWSATASFLRAKQSLKRLQVSGFTDKNDPSDDDLRMLGQSLADNISLEMLDLNTSLDSQTWQGYADFVSGVGCNMTLRSLTLDKTPDPDTFPSRTVFEHAMERNYGLENVTFTEGDWTSIMVETICKLNAAGRKYMLVDSTSRTKGVDVLSRVNNNLDCLYYHLRENPSLCNLNEHRNDIEASPPAKSRKRRRCPQSTDAEQFVGAPSGSSFVAASCVAEPKRQRPPSNDCFFL